MTDYLHVNEAKPEAECQVHDWPTDGLAGRLLDAMRERHPRGIDVCRECVHRAKQDADRRRGKPLGGQL